MKVDDFSNRAAPQCISDRAVALAVWIVPTFVIIAHVFAMEIWPESTMAHRMLPLVVGAYIVYFPCFWAVNTFYARRASDSLFTRRAFLTQAFAQDEDIALSAYEESEVMQVINGNKTDGGVEVAVRDGERILVRVEGEALRVYREALVGVESA